jgi:hypothetical protein
MSMTFGESTSGKLSDFEYKSCWLCGCGPWRWYKGVGEIYMDKGRVGEESKGKETDRCPLTCAHFIPMHTTITAEGAPRLYLQDVWKHHGTPRVVLSDRGSQFIAGFTRCGELCPSVFNSFELPSWMLYQDVQLLWDSGLVRGESGYSL